MNHKVISDEASCSGEHITNGHLFGWNMEFSFRP